MLADAKHIQPRLIRQLRLLDEVRQPLFGRNDRLMTVLAATEANV